jgi:hypothetical protein
MATQKVLTTYATASGALDFDTNGAAIKNIANGGVAWCKPITKTTPCYPRVQVFYQIKTHSTAPTAGGTIEFYVLRNDGTLQGCADLGTLTDHGTSTTAANIARLRSNFRPSKVAVVDANTSVIYTGSFMVDEPGTNWQIVVYNGTGQVLANEDSVHIVEYRTLEDDIQASA